MKMKYENARTTYFRALDHINIDQVEDVVMLGFNLNKYLDENPLILEKLKTDRSFKLTKELIGQ